MRKPDVPGSYRIKKQTDGRFLLSGVSHRTGKRIKFANLDYHDAEKTALEVFGRSDSVINTTDLKPDIAPIPTLTGAKDDWGLPIGISVDKASAVNASMGLVHVATQTNQAKGASGPSTEESAEKKVKRAKQAKSLMELAGVAFAAGDVWAGRRVTQAIGCDPVNPNPRQVNDLAEVTKETLQEWFGDVNIKPWQMMFLLALGIPISMMIQSPRIKKPAVEPLKAVQ